MKLRIQHRTTYRYSESVLFGPHQIMLRPREGHDIQIESSILEIEPAHKINWIRDVLGNSVAVARFTESARELMVYSDVVLNHFEVNPFDVYLDADAVTYPFSYNYDTSMELAALALPVYGDDCMRVREWTAPFWTAGQIVDTLDLLRKINSQISGTFRYQIRNEEGVQSPGETLTRKSGSCRDFATLFVEACRCLGFGARFVSGYILSGGEGAGEASTHAWAEVYLPGVGWKGFDPTLGLLTVSQHVAVAVSRRSENAMPVSGSFGGMARAEAVEVNVRVTDIGTYPPDTGFGAPQRQSMRATS